MCVCMCLNLISADFITLTYLLFVGTHLKGVSKHFMPTGKFSKVNALNKT